LTRFYHYLQIGALIISKPEYYIILDCPNSAVLLFYLNFFKCRYLCGIIPDMGLFNCENECFSGHCHHPKVLTSLELPNEQGYDELGKLLIAGMKFSYLTSQEALPEFVTCNGSNECTGLKRI
jgi:hypothetical protein